MSVGGLSVTHAAHLSPVEVDDLPDYPFSSDDRLDSHYFVPWERRRWLNSDMRLKGTPECRAIYLDLIWISYEQSPMGSLPCDIEILAKLAFVEQSHFTRLCDLPYGPLHNWERCRVNGLREIRLMHSMVVKTLLEATARKETNRAVSEAGNRRTRLSRLRSSISGLDKSLAENDHAVTWIDGWLNDQNVGYRDAKWIERGLHAYGTHRLELNMAGSGRGR